MYSSIDTGDGFRWEILNPSPEIGSSFDWFEQKGKLPVNINLIEDDSFQAKGVLFFTSLNGLHCQLPVGIISYNHHMIHSHQFRQGVCSNITFAFPSTFRFAFASPLT